MNWSIKVSKKKLVTQTMATSALLINYIITPKLYDVDN